MKKFANCIISAFLYACTTNAQTDSSIYLYIMNDTILMSVQQSGNYVVPAFSDSNINNITDNYNFTVFRQAFTTSRYPDMKKVYELKCDNTNVAAILSANYPDIFPYFSVSELVLCAGEHTPNDWTRSHAWYVWPWALDYIQARQAWGLPYPWAKGDPSVIIGITDTYFDMGNPDLSSKIVYYDVNVVPTSHLDHGTQVAGQAAAASDNSIGYPSVGFNCSLRTSTIMSAGKMLEMSETGPYKAKVLNASWLTGGDYTLSLESWLPDRMAYDEVYENGVVTCVAAGNGFSTFHAPPKYTYPSSFDHIISTTMIRGEDCWWTGGSGCCCDEHSGTPGDTMYTFQHNPRVDICAPAIKVGGLTYDTSKTDSLRYFCHDCSWGTSFASPQTAGVVGLMRSVNPCLSPYQLEYALKKGARADIYSVPNNAFVASPKRIGVGALNAHQAVIWAFGPGKCNEPTTQTFHVSGVEINTLCAPGFASNSVNPVLNCLVKNGTPPYTYRWEPLPGNTAILSNYNSASVTVTSSSGSHFFAYYLTVYDASEVQKVANKKFQFNLSTANTYELASRDSYMDFLAEPNSQEYIDPREWDFWSSPDVWNRHTNDGNTTPENVEYFSSGAPNYMHYRVRNVGCADYPATDNAGVHLHWTLASTGEDWAFDWQVANVPAAAGGTLPAGRKITTTGAIPVPNLAPGAEYIGSKEWYPVNPAAYAGSPEAAGICFLSRLVEPVKPLLGMAYSEITHTTTNVKNNNNIVTHNVDLVNLGRKRVPGIRGAIRTTRMYVGNSNDVVSAFNLNMLTDRDIHLHFAGNPSEYMYVSLQLEEGLWDAWETGGYLGNYATKDNNSRTVTYDPSSPLMLENITIDTNEKFYIDMSFKLRDGVAINTPIAGKMFHFRQLEATTGEVHGNVSFELNIEQDDTTTRKGVLAVTELSEGPSAGCQYAELAVANCGVNMADQVDVRGWIINDNSGILASPNCETYNVNRGHFRLAYDEVWARVPVGSSIMLYNQDANCYNLSDTFRYDTANARYWVPVGGSGNLHIEQFEAIENSSICDYCSDTGTTIYTNADDWTGIAGLDPVFDAIQVLCPGCTAEVPADPAFYFAAGHFAETYDANWTPSAIGEASIGTVLASNTDSSSGFKYKFIGSTAEELLDPERWEVSVADNSGQAPSSLGSLPTAFKTAVVDHELTLPCCATGEQSKPGIRKHTVAGGADFIKVYPNPASTLLYFEFPISANVSIRLMDITGKVIDEQALRNTGKAAFEVKAYTPGLYIYQVICNGGRKQVGKVVIGK